MTEHYMNLSHCQNILEDEKVKGTIHIAIGNNTGFGGKTLVPLHLDGIITKPNVWVDNLFLIEKGNLVV